MFNLFAPAPMWNQGGYPVNQQYVYAYPTPTYVVQAPHVLHAPNHSSQQQAITSRNSAWRGTTAAPPASESYSGRGNDEPKLSTTGPVTPMRLADDSSDDVFFPTSNNVRNTQPFFNFDPRGQVAMPPKQANFTFTGYQYNQTNNGVIPMTPGIRIPERYKTIIAKKTISTRRTNNKDSVSYRQRSTFINGSLDASGDNTSGSSQYTTENSPNHSGIASFRNTSSTCRSEHGRELQLSDLSAVTRATASSNSSDENVSTSPPLRNNRQQRSRNIEQRSRGEMSSISSFILPLSVRDAINEDPPEPIVHVNTAKSTATPLKTSSPIREADEFMALPTVRSSVSSRPLKENHRNIPAPIGTEVSTLKVARGQYAIEAPKRVNRYIDNRYIDNVENVSPGGNSRKRRNGRYITAAATETKTTTSTTLKHATDECQCACRAKSARRQIVDIREEDEDELDQCELIIQQQKELGTAEEQARKREEFLLVLEAERERQRRLVLPKKAPKMSCKFCRNNGEDEEVFSKHRLHDRERTVCPILRHYVCRLCNSTGDFAHTIRHCPFNNRKDSLAWKATFLV